MYHAVMSGAYHGMDSFLVQVEVDISNGLPGMDMVGCLASEVKETKERVRVGLKNSGYDLPAKRITVSLSPADVRKDGSGFDLPVALGILGALECKDHENEREEMTNDIIDKKVNKTTNVIILGEIGLDGTIKRAKGILPILTLASENKITNCILPYENRFEASNVKGMNLFPVRTLEEAQEVYKKIEYVEKTENPIENSEYESDTNDVENTENINNKDNIIDKNDKKANEYRSYLRKIAFVIDKNDTIVDREDNNSFKRNKKTDVVNKGTLDFWQVKGQEHAKRAAMIAAAGFHNLLLFGPPGSGKSMIAQRLPTIMRDMNYEECLEVTKICSVAGTLDENTTLVTKHPFMSPHHTITEAALVGGGAIPRPGVITLAHKGVLFLDELPEFGRRKLDLLRQPLEEKMIQISKMNYTCNYQADFMLVAAMNPCPCGYFPDRNKCNCSPHEIQKYLSNISGPLLDRIDLSVEVGRMSWEQIETNYGSKTDGKIKNYVNQWGSAYMKEKVNQAIYMQMERNGGKYNSALTGDEIEKYCNMDTEANNFLKFAFNKMQLSMRSLIRLKKVARTIADLDGEEMVSKLHVSEAVMLNKGLERLKNSKISTQNF